MDSTLTIFAVDDPTQEQAAALLWKLKKTLASSSLLQSHHTVLWIGPVLPL